MKHAKKTKEAENIEAENQDVNVIGDEQQEVLAEEAQLEESSAEERSDFEMLVSELNKKLVDLNDKHIRLSAEFDNYRKRTLKEKMELTKTGGENILKGILPVVDDFDRALAHVDDAKDLQAVKDGIGLIYNKLKDFLNQQGIKVIVAKGEVFDTDLHEAITKVPAPTEDMKGKVLDCVENGYTLNDKVIRFSKVVIAE